MVSDHPIRPASRHGTDSVARQRIHGDEPAGQATAGPSKETILSLLWQHGNEEEIFSDYRHMSRPQIAGEISSLSDRESELRLAVGRWRTEIPAFKRYSVHTLLSAEKAQF